VDSMMVTYSLLGLPFAIIRPIIALFTGIFGGLLTNFAVNKTPQIEENIIADEQIETGNKLIRMFKYGFVTFLQDLSKWLVIGILIAAGIAVFIPDNFFAEYMSNPFLEMLIVLLISIPMYVCATGSIPIAAVLLMKGVSPGAALVFMMAGPATNVATITVLAKTMGKKSLMIYLSTITLGAIVFGLLLNWLVPADFILSKMPHFHGQGHEHEMLPHWFQLLSALLLVVSMVLGYFYLKLNKKNKMQTIEGITVTVTGMTCSHCEANVKKNLEALHGITNVVADNKTNTVKISGANIDLQKIKSTVNGLGYRFAAPSEP